jgi:hypothetical protein
MPRKSDRVFISATEVADFVYCEKAWQLKRSGVAARSEQTEPGRQFHRRHGAAVGSAGRERRLSVRLGVLALLLLLAAMLLWAAENLAR